MNHAGVLKEEQQQVQRYVDKLENVARDVANVQITTTRRAAV